MKQLFWKEAMEARFLPITLLLLSMTVLVVWYSVSLAAVFVPVCCMVVGLVAGCSGIASEFGRGTIKFLTSLPLSKNQVWLCKLYSTTSISAITCALLTCGAVIYASKLFAHPFNVYNGDLIRDIAYLQWWVVPLSMALFGMACSVFSSTLVDRPLTAIILSVVTAAALLSVFLRITSGYESLAGLYWSTLNYAVIDIVACILLAASYIAFTRGNDQGLRRPVVIASALSIACLVVFGFALVLVGYIVPQSVDDRVGYALSEINPDPVGSANTIVVDCPSAPIQQSYEFEVRLEVSTFKAASLTSDDRSITGGLCFPLAVSDIIPIAKIYYRAEAPLGKKQYRLRVLDKRGQIVETILINVTNVRPAGAPKQ